MAKTNSDSKYEFEVGKELFELEEAFESLLKDSKVLITHYLDLKKKNEEFTLQILDKNKIIQELSDKNLSLLEKNKFLSSFLKDLKELDSSTPFVEVETLQRY